jgi:hypothetical protein
LSSAGQKALNDMKSIRLPIGKDEAWRCVCSF